jgi:hypothetical protein
MFEVSAAQLWSGLFLFEAPPSVGGSLHGKGSALFPEGDDLLNISMSFLQKRSGPLTLSVSQPFFNTLMSSFVTGIIQPSGTVSGTCILM